MKNNTINHKFITRFAPSPTGFLHIGNARTAIFNYLLTKHYQGSFFLRIEDTDQARFTTQAVDVIFESLQFLNIEHDNKEILYQSQRTARYHEVIEELLKTGKAYKCYHTMEEIEKMRENNNSSINWVFRSFYRDLSPDHQTHIDLANKPYTVRLKIPNTANEDEITTFTDIVQGKISVKNKDIEDFTLLRSDGSPTYMLAVCVDDHDMDITHIFRGADHLTNTFKQLHLFKAMNWRELQYGHIPLIHDISGKKLSKRDGAIGVLDFAKQGILPQALFNYLMRLGWGYKDEEFITLDRAVEIFSEKGFGKSAAKFDFNKMLDLNAKWIRFLPNDQLLKEIKQYANKYTNTSYQTTDWERFAKGLDGLKTRAKTIIDLLNMGQIYLDMEYKVDTDVTFPEVYLSQYKHIISVIMSFLDDSYLNTKQAETAFRNLCSQENIDFKIIAPWLRKKLTGKEVSPSLFDVIVVLGKQVCLNRLKN